MKIVLWDFQAPPPKPPVYQSELPGWQTIASGSVRFSRDGIVSVRWGVLLEVERPHWFGMLWQHSNDFEFRIELGGKYVYSYRAPEPFEPLGLAAAQVTEGPADMFVMLHLPKSARATVRGLTVEIVE